MNSPEPVEHALEKIRVGWSPAEQETVRLELAARINELLLHDFQRVVLILYRVDVSEKKLKQLLQDHPQTDAGLLIADLLIERQLEKIRTRAAFRGTDDIPEEDRW